MARINSIKAVAVSFEEVTIGECRLIHADCRDVLPTLPRFDLLLTDPPYGIGADKNLRANQQHGSAAAPSRDYGVGSWDCSPPSAEEIAAMINTASHSILWGGNYFVVAPSSCWLVWDKENGANGYADCELAWTNLRQAVRRIKWRWAGMLQEVMSAKEDRVHPTQKPVAVMAWCLDQVPAAKSVLDPFMGSGTTGVACAQSGRSFTGIERERKYFDIAVERISRAYAQGKLFAPEIVKPEQGALV
jgi:DNA modification methylase